MTTTDTMERATLSGGNCSIFFFVSRRQCEYGRASRRSATRVSEPPFERDAWSATMHTYNRRSASAYSEITAAIQRVQREGRTIVREVPTMPEPGYSVA